MISHGADVEARNAMDSTPLISAATAGNVDALRMLTDNGEGAKYTLLSCRINVTRMYVPKTQRMPSCG